MGAHQLFPIGIGKQSVLTCTSEPLMKTFCINFIFAYSDLTHNTIMQRLYTFYEFCKIQFVINSMSFILLIALFDFFLYLKFFAAPVRTDKKIYPYSLIHLFSLPSFSVGLVLLLQHSIWCISHSCLSLSKLVIFAFFGFLRCIWGRQTQVLFCVCGVLSAKFNMKETWIKQWSWHLLILSCYPATVLYSCC